MESRTFKNYYLRFHHSSLLIQVTSFHLLTKLGVNNESTTEGSGVKNKKIIHFVITVKFDSFVLV